MDVHRATAGAVVAIALFGAVSAAQAAAPDTHTIRIPYQDLDVATDEGLALLYGRVRMAARKVCGAPAITGTRIDTRHRACMRDAVARAIGQLGVPRLAELHSELESASPPATCAAPVVAHRRIII